LPDSSNPGFPRADAFRVFRPFLFPLLLAAVSATVFFMPTMRMLCDAYLGDDDFSHGFIVVLFSA
jgi:hypothetical protein